MGIESDPLHVLFYQILVFADLVDRLLHLHLQPFYQLLINFYQLLEALYTHSPVFPTLSAPLLITCVLIIFIYLHPISGLLSLITLYLYCLSLLPLTALLPS